MGKVYQLVLVRFLSDSIGTMVLTKRASKTDQQTTASETEYVFLLFYEITLSKKYLQAFEIYWLSIPTVCLDSKGYL